MPAARAVAAHGFGQPAAVVRHARHERAAVVFQRDAMRVACAWANPLILGGRLNAARGSQRPSRQPVRGR
jgi:hypothetical protein